MTNNTEDGYAIIPPREKLATKGICCGACGMKFDHNKAYGFCCQRSDCPVFNNPTCTATP